MPNGNEFYELENAWGQLSNALHDPSKPDEGVTDVTELITDQNLLNFIQKVYGINPKEFPSNKTDLLLNLNNAISNFITKENMAPPVYWQDKTLNYDLATRGVKQGQPGLTYRVSQGVQYESPTKQKMYNGLEKFNLTEDQKKQAVEQMYQRLPTSPSSITGDPIQFEIGNEVYIYDPGGKAGDEGSFNIMVIDKVTEKPKLKLNEETYVEEKEKTPSPLEGQETSQLMAMYNQSIVLGDKDNAQQYGYELAQRGVKLPKKAIAAGVSGDIKKIDPEKAQKRYRRMFDVREEGYKCGGKVKGYQDGGEIENQLMINNPYPEYEQEQEGGEVIGPGGPNDDMVMAGANEGDFIIPADAPEQIKQLLIDELDLGINDNADGTVPVRLSDGELRIPFNIIEEANKILMPYGLTLSDLAPEAESSQMAEMPSTEDTPYPRKPELEPGVNGIGEGNPNISGYRFGGEVLRDHMRNRKINMDLDNFIITDRGFKKKNFTEVANIPGYSKGGEVEHPPIVDDGGQTRDKVIEREYEKIPQRKILTQEEFEKKYFSPIDAIVEELKPELSKKQIESLKKRGALDRLGQALGSIMDTYYFTKGAPIQRKKPIDNTRQQIQSIEQGYKGEEKTFATNRLQAAQMKMKAYLNYLNDQEMADQYRLKSQFESQDWRRKQAQEEEERKWREREAQKDRESAERRAWWSYMKGNEEQSDVLLQDREGNEYMVPSDKFGALQGLVKDKIMSDENMQPEEKTLAIRNLQETTKYKWNDYAEIDPRTGDIKLKTSPGIGSVFQTQPRSMTAEDKVENMLKSMR